MSGSDKYMFGVRNFIVSPSDSKRLDRIARQHDAEFWNVDMPDGDRCWFQCQNLGGGIDDAVRDAVLAAVREAGFTQWGDS